MPIFSNTTGIGTNINIDIIIGTSLVTIAKITLHVCMYQIVYHV